MKFVTTANELTIVLDRKEQIAAFKAKIVIKRKEVAELKWCDKFSDWRRWQVRLPGASIPRRLIAGSYWTELGWDFLYLRRPVGLRSPVVADVIVINLKGHSRFERVAISGSTADYKYLNKWLKNK